MVENFSFQFDLIYHHFSFDHLIITHYKRFTASHVPRHLCLFFNNYCEFCKMVEDFSSQFDPIYYYFSFGHSGIGHPVYIYHSFPIYYYTITLLRCYYNISLVVNLRIIHIAESNFPSSRMNNGPFLRKTSSLVKS